MKKITIIAIFICVQFLSFAQDTSKCWNLTIHDESFSPQHPHPTWAFYGLKTGADTLIAGKPYKKLFKSFDKLFAEVSLIGGIREDSNRIYLSKSIYSPDEILLYDFNVDAGDTVIINHLINIDHLSSESITATVDSVNTILIDGKLRKRFFITYTCVGEDYSDIWIEGIGSIKNGLLNESCACLTGCYTRTFLKCYSENNVLIWRDTTFKDCYDDFQVDCGNDIVFCTPLNIDTSYHLGSGVKLSHGNAPYTYKWSCKIYQVGSSNLTASTFLNDTTLLNPYFKDLPLDDDRLIFYLTVKDNNDNVAIDTINIRFSRFTYSLGYTGLILNIGDSIRFVDILVGGGIKPLKYNWTPSIGLSDSTETYPWCKPLISTDYYIKAIDSVGCKSEFNLVYRITVIPALIRAMELNRNSIISYQVGSKIIFENSQNFSAVITLYTVDGKIVSQSKTYDSYFDFGDKILQGTIYCYIIRIKDKWGIGKFIN